MSELFFSNLLRMTARLHFEKSIVILKYELKNSSVSNLWCMNTESMNTFNLLPLVIALAVHLVQLLHKTDRK